MGHSALRWLCICALSAVPLWSAAGCGSGPGGDGGFNGGGGTGGIGGTGGGSGASGSGGTAGGGGQPDLCANVSCDDQNDCTVDGACDPSSGECVDGGDVEPIDVACGPGSTGYCDDAGQCVDCNRSAQCPDEGNPCTTAICVSGECGTANAGGPCDFVGTAGVCQGGACVDADLCAPYPCQDPGVCRTDQCDPANGMCTYGNEPNGSVCSANGYAGECNAGLCDLCAPVQCNDGNQCTIDGTCNPATGNCDGAGNVSIHTACNQNGGKACDGRGRCVGCNSVLDCSDGNPCTSDSCSPTLRICSNTRAADGTLCGTTALVCIQGVCTSDTLGRQTFSGDRSDLVSGSSYNGIASAWSGFYRYGLSGFYLNFTGSGVDHELDRIMPGFFEREFSSQTSGTETVLFARYEDQNADDAYNWTIDAQELPYGSTRHVKSGCVDIGGINQLVGQIPAGTEPVMLGFDLDRSTDHNLETLEARIYRNFGTYAYIEVIFEDAGSSDPFCWEMQYALIPSNRVRASGHFADTTSRKGSHTQSITATRPIMQGVRLWFTNGDHHVDQVGLRVLPGEIRVWLNDQNNDDPFRWEAWWLDLE